MSKRISQRAAAMWRRRARAAEALVDSRQRTPHPRLEIARFTLPYVCEEKVNASVFFGARIRAEIVGNQVVLVAYQLPEVLREPSP